MLRDDSILADTLDQYQLKDIQSTDEDASKDKSIFDLVLEGRADLLQDRLNELRRVGGDVSTILNEVNQDGCVPIHYACWVGSLEIVQLLHDCSVVSQLETMSQIQCTPLHYAAWSGVSGDLCKYLVEQGASINAKNEDGFTPLILSVRCGNYDTSKSLLDCCGPQHVNDKDTAGCTAFHHACHEANEEMCRLLLTFHADALILDNSGRRPFDVCDEEFSLHIRQIIYEHGDDEDDFLTMGPPSEDNDDDNNNFDAGGEATHRGHGTPPTVIAHPPAHAQSTSFS